MNLVAETRIAWDALLPLGFSEVKTSSFAETGKLAVERPANVEKPFLRDNMVESMRDVLVKNWAHRAFLNVPDIRVFEIGSIFGRDADGPIEGPVISVAVMAATQAAADEAARQAVMRMPLRPIVEDASGDVPVVGGSYRIVTVALNA